MENFNNVPSQGKYGDSIAVVNENFMLVQQKMEVLENLVKPASIATCESIVDELV